MGLEKINIYKKELGLTNDDLAKLSGVPKSTIDKITAGKTYDPKLETVRAIAKALGKTLDDFDDDRSRAVSGSNLETNKTEQFNDLTIISVDGDDPTPRQLVQSETSDFIEEIMALDNDELSELKLMLQFMKYKKEIRAYGKKDEL